MFAGNFAPAGWVLCEGQLLLVAQNQDLFGLISNIYGGNGQTTFAVPDLRGRIPVHQAKGYDLANTGGVEQVTLTAAQMASHSHSLLASLNIAGGSTPTGNVTGQVGATQIYREAPPGVAMSVSSLTPTGGALPHTNIQPFLCINYIMCLLGDFPKPNQ
jgi:microcystin-dependent protein